MSIYWFYHGVGMKIVLLASVALLSFSCVSVPKEPLPKKPELPSIGLEQLPLLDPSTGKLRALTADELSKTRTYLQEKRAKVFTEEERDLINGDCFNNSGRWAGIYGPNISGRPYDNDLYMVPPSYKSPDGWDCDGFFVPSDVTVQMIALAVTLNQSGPGAVKINSAQWGTLVSTGPLSRQISASVLEWIGPGNPTNWYRPGFPQQDLDDLGDTWRPKPPAGR